MRSNSCIRHRVPRNLVRVVALLLFSVMSASAVASSMEVLPGVSAPGTEVLVRGEDFISNEWVELSMEIEGGGPPIALGTALTDESGRFLRRVTLPEVAPGNYIMLAVVRNLLDTTVDFQISSGTSLIISPDRGPPQTPVSVSFGDVPAGLVTIFYADVPVIGPLAHGGGVFEAQFTVPADRPEPLGSSTTIRATLQAGGSVVATASAAFQSQPEESDAVTLAIFSGPTQPLSPGEVFNFSGRVQVPSFRQPSDYQWSMAVRATDGQLIPVNLRPIVMDAAGNFSGEGVMPGPVSGAGLVNFLETTPLGMVYRLPGNGDSAFLEAVNITYTDFEVQNLRFKVMQSEDSVPIEDAVVNVFANTLFVPEGWSYEEDGLNLGNGRAANTVFKPTWSALQAPPNQYQDAVQQIIQGIGQHNNEITGCPVTLTSGLTDAQGEWQTNAVPFLNWLLDAGAQSASQVDINTTITGPGKATFSVKLGAVHEGRGLVNDDGICTGQRFDFQYDYDTDQWLFKSTLDGDFDEPFNPNEVIEVFLPECGEAPIGIPADPYMPGLPSKDVTIFNTPFRQFGALWSFPDVNGATFNVEEVPQLRLPHLSAVFGLLEDATVFIDDVEMGQMDVGLGSCGADGLEYVLDLPELIAYPAGTYTGRVEATMLGGQAVQRFFQIDIQPGPTWINQASDFDSRQINWMPNKVSLRAVEPTRSQTANTGNPGFGIGPLDNDNESSAVITQVLTPSGAGGRQRKGGASSTAVSEPNEPVSNSTNANGSSPSNPVPFGSMSPVTVLDTGKIPLFRYTWGIPPIASASCGADVWFVAQYRYFGEAIMTNHEVSVDVTTEAIAQAGLDLWLDASVIMDLVSLDAFALPNFTLTMPIVVEDNEINTQASQPCFDFALDVSWSVQVGWCPFCIKAGDLANLFRVQDGAGCSAEAPPRTLAAPTPPLVPPIDRTSLAADGQGRSSLVWGDGSGQIQLQHFTNGVGDIFESLAAGPGASGADIAFFDANRSVLVWSQSSLSEADFMALDGDPADPTDGDFVTAAASRQLVYRVNNGGGWSNTQALTPPFSGDGGVVLASCPATSSVCPSGGEVLAAWVHDAAGNVNLHDLKLRYSFFNGTSWSPVRDVDASSTAKDLQPAPAYLGADPVVFWVRNPSVTDDGSTATFDLSQRRLAYRFLRQLAGTQEPAGLPLGIASPSAQPFGQDSLVLAFSKATEPDAFIGTRRALHTAYATQCFEGVCQFNGSQERKDSLGRRIYVERPQITRNGNNQAVVTFRQIGVDNATADDPTGILTHSGALMQLSFALDPLAQVPTSDPFELSSIGGVNWRVDAIFDAASNSVLTSAVQVDQTAALQALGLPVGEAINGVNERRFGVTNGDLVLVERPMLADYEVLSAQIDRDWIAEGDMAQLTIRYRNNGIDPFGSPTIATFWNGPAGLGLAGPSQTVADPPVGQVQELVMSLPLPKDLSSDDSHTLAITINPFGASDEADGSNNSVELLIGELPSPENVVNVDGDTTGIIVLHWDPVDDERVTGYRIYRQNPDGTVLNVGSSAVSGFADFAAYPGQRYEYFVTSRTLGLVESSPSRLVVARTRSPDRLFSDRFE